MHLEAAFRLEILAIEAQTPHRRGVEARAGEQHRVVVLVLLGAGDERQARDHVDQFVGVGIPHLILAIAQAAVPPVIEEEVGVVLLAIGTAQEGNLRHLTQLLLQRPEIRRLDLHLDLHLEALLAGHAADGDQLAEHALLAAHQEGIDVAGQRVGLLANLLHIDREQLAVAHQPRAIDHHILDVLLMGGVDDPGVDVLGIAVELGDAVRPRQREGDQIRALAGFQRAGDLRDVHRARAHNRRHLQNLARGQHRGIHRAHLGDQRGQAQLLDHIQGVVAGRAIGADAHVQPDLEHLIHLRDAAGQLEVAAGIVRDAHVVVLERVHLALVQVDAVRGRGPGLEDAQLLKPRHRRHIVLLAVIFDLLGRLGDVDVQRRVELQRQIHGPLDQLRRDGVGRVRRDAGNHQRMTAPTHDIIPRPGQALLVAGGIGAGEFEDALQTDAAQPGLDGGVGHRLLEVVHIHKGGRAGADHLGGGDLRPQPAEVRIDEVALDGHHIAHQPDIQAQIVGQRAEQRHRCVAVGVDQPRHQDGVAGVHALGGGVLLQDLGLRANRRNILALDGHRARRVNRIGVVHRQHKIGGDDEIDLLRG